MEIDLNLVNRLINNFISFLPNLIGGIVFILACILLYKLILYIVKKLLKFSKISELNKKLNQNEIIQKSDFKINLENIIIQIVRWLLILMILVIGADFFGLNMVSHQISNLINYLPQLFSAILIFVVGFYFANKIKELLQNILKSFDLNGSNIIGNIIFYLMLIFISITALNQAGVNTDIITNNLSIIMGAILLTFTVAFGLGSRDIVYRLLLGFYTNKNLAIGQRIIFQGNEGVIVAINNIALTLQTQDKTILIPIEKLNNDDVIIIKKDYE